MFNEKYVIHHKHRYGIVCATPVSIQNLTGGFLQSRVAPCALWRRYLKLIGRVSHSKRCGTVSLLFLDLTLCSACTPLP